MEQQEKDSILPNFTMRNAVETAGTSGVKSSSDIQRQHRLCRKIVGKFVLVAVVVKGIVASKGQEHAEARTQ